MAKKPSAETITDLRNMQAEAKADVVTLQNKTVKTVTAQDFLLKRALERQDRLFGILADLFGGKK